MLPTHDGRKFTWTSTFGVTEASDLSAVMYARVWNDAVDVGFNILSHRTGRSMLFTLTRENIDDNGDLVSQVFSNADGTIKVTVLND